MNNLAAESKKTNNLKHNVNQLNHYSSPYLLSSFIFFLNTKSLQHTLETRENYDQYGSNKIDYKQTINRLLFLELCVS